MDVLSAILACSLYFDDKLVRAVIHVNSSGVQYFVGDTKSLVSYDYPTTVESAKAALQKVLDKGGRPAIGLMAVPVDWAATFGRQPDELWDSCTNIAVGTAMLSTFEYECEAPADEAPAARVSRTRSGPPPRQARRRPRAQDIRACVVTKLGKALGIEMFPQAVFMALATQERRDRAEEDEAAARSPVFPDGSDEATLKEAKDWSSDRVFLRAPDAPGAAPPGPGRGTPSAGPPVAPARSPAVPERPAAPPRPSLPTAPPPARR